MGIFSEIWDRITVDDEERRQHREARERANAPHQPQTAPRPAPAAVNVEAVLEQKAAAKGGGNWRTSIVDLLKLLDIDSSLDARKELATELGCPPELMGDSAKMNVWLHKAVLAKVAANGGVVPKELLD